MRKLVFHDERFTGRNTRMRTVTFRHVRYRRAVRAETTMRHRVRLTSFVVKRAADRLGDAERATTTGVGASAGPAEPAGATVGGVGREDNLVVEGTGVNGAGAMLAGAVVVGAALVVTDVVVAIAAVSPGGTTATAPVDPPVPPPVPAAGGAVVVVDVDAPPATVVVVGVVVVVVAATLIPVARAFITSSSASGGRLLYGWSALSERTVTTPA